MKLNWCYNSFLLYSGKNGIELHIWGGWNIWIIAVAPMEIFRLIEVHHGRAYKEGRRVGGQGGFEKG